MTIYKLFDNVTQFFSEAVARIFGPTDDSYPDTGVQPFEGDPNKKQDKDW